KGGTDAAREHLARFQKITTEHLGAPFGAGYGDQGKFSLAELAKSELSDAPAAIPVRFVSQQIGALLKGSGTGANFKPSTGACFIDYDGDGKSDLLLVSGTAEGTSRLLRNVGAGKFEDVTQTTGIQLVGAGLGCAVGDFDNDGHADLAVCLN